MLQEITDVIDFPLSPRFFIEQSVAERPCLGAIAERLPSLDAADRLDEELVMAKLFSLMLHEPRLSYDEAKSALDHDAAPDDVAADELAEMRSDPGLNGLYEIWEAIWADEADAGLKDRARYYAALLARLYRLEYRIRSEAALAA